MIHKLPNGWTPEEFQKNNKKNNANNSKAVLHADYWLKSFNLTPSELEATASISIEQKIQKIAKTRGVGVRSKLDFIITINGEETLQCLKCQIFNIYREIIIFNCNKSKSLSST